MPEETFVVPITKTITTVEHVEPALKQLAWEAGTDTAPARAIVILQAKDETGEWDESCVPLRAEMEDVRDENGELSEPRLVFHAFGLMLDAVIPAADPRAIALGMGGKTVREMGEALVRQKLAEDGSNGD